MLYTGVLGLEGLDVATYRTVGRALGFASSKAPELQGSCKSMCFTYQADALRVLARYRNPFPIRAIWRGTAAPSDSALE